MLYKTVNYSQIKVVLGSEIEFKQIFRTCLSILDEIGSRFPDSAQQYRSLLETSRSREEALLKHVTTLNGDSLSGLLTIARGYKDDILDMAGSCQDEHDYGSTVFYYVNALDRLEGVFRKLLRDQIDAELISLGACGQSSGEGRYSYSSPKTTKLRILAG